MKVRKLLFVVAGALMVSTLPASAAPTLGSQLKTTAAENSAVDHVNYRRCWRGHDGLRRCRYVRRYYRSYGYAPYYDDGYYGYGYGPSLGLYFGGGGHRGHWRRHHW